VHGPGNKNVGNVFINQSRYKLQVPPRDLNQEIADELIHATWPRASPIS